MTGGLCFLLVAFMFNSACGIMCTLASDLFDRDYIKCKRDIIVALSTLLLASVVGYIGLKILQLIILFIDLPPNRE